MSKRIVTGYGSTVITDQVLESLAGMATTECYGVAGMAARNIQDGIAAILRQDSLNRGVSVSYSEDDGALDITVNIVVGYGVNISQVARNIREKVRYVVTHASGFPVSNVRINVKGVKVTSLDD